MLQCKQSCREVIFIANTIDLVEIFGGCTQTQTHMLSEDWRVASGNHNGKAAEGDYAPLVHGSA